ncbi:MAG: Mth938-like domain-containing protein [Planctomycetota bacterium]|jgi:hypothetical protein
MKIDSYSLGTIKVDGTEYTGDLIIFPDKIKTNWWRKQGHSLAIDDLADVLDFKPDVLVVGKGAYGMMNVPPKTEKFIQDQAIVLIAEKTSRACEIFNEKNEKSTKVAGAFHLTC